MVRATLSILLLGLCACSPDAPLDDQPYAYGKADGQSTRFELTSADIVRAQSDGKAPVTIGDTTYSVVGKSRYLYRQTAGMDEPDQVLFHWDVEEMHVYTTPRDRKEILLTWAPPGRGSRGEPTHLWATAGISTFDPEWMGYQSMFGDSDIYYHFIESTDMTVFTARGDSRVLIGFSGEDRNNKERHLLYYSRLNRKIGFIEFNPLEIDFEPTHFLKKNSKLYVLSRQPASDSSYRVYELKVGTEDIDAEDLSFVGEFSMTH